MELHAHDYTPRRSALALSGLIVGLFASVSSAMIVATALPTIAAEFSRSPASSVWVIVASLAAMTLATPTWGYLADRFDLKRVAQAAVGVFVLGSLGAGFSNHLEELIAMRAIQGVAMGGLMVTSQALVRVVAPPHRIAAYSGYLGAAMSFASLSGPVMGGAIVDAPGLGWRWCFWLLIPLALTSLVIINLGVRPTSASSRARTQIPARGLLARPNFRWAIVASVAIGAVMFSSILFLSQYFQLGRGYSATVAGLLSTPMLLATLVTSIVAGHTVHKIGLRPVLVTGATLLIAGLVGMAGLGLDLPLWLIITASVLVGGGIGTVMQNFILVAQSSATRGAVGRATSSISMARSLSGAVSIWGLGGVTTVVLAGATGQAAYTDASAVVFAILAALSTVSLVAALFVRTENS